MIVDIDVRRIHADPNDTNPCTDEQIAAMAENIKVYGLINPARVMPIAPNQYQLVAGKKRWKAYILLKRKALPCWLVEPGTKQVVIDGMTLPQNLEHRSCILST